MKSIVKAILLITFSGAIGLTISTLVFAIFIETNEPIEEWVTSFWWFLMYYLVAALIFYLPVMFLLRRILNGCRPAWLFPIMAILAGIVPILLFTLHWGGGFDDVEGLVRLFAMYAPVGLLFGGGFVWLFSNNAV